MPVLEGLVRGRSGPALQSPSVKLQALLDVDFYRNVGRVPEGQPTLRTTARTLLKA